MFDSWPNDRFWSKVLPEPNSGCWLWTAALDTKGYGQFGSSPVKRAHRLSYEAIKGPIPAGLDLDHLCRVRCCVNPDHLEPVTRRENLMRGPTIAAHHATKMCCDNGHPLDGDNLVINKGGWRRCKICRNASARKTQTAARERKYADRGFPPRKWVRRAP